MAVHPYTLQDDMLVWTSQPLDEHILYIDHGIDGIFTEFPHVTKSAFLKFKSNNNFPPATSNLKEDVKNVYSEWDWVSDYLEKCY